MLPILTEDILLCSKRRSLSNSFLSSDELTELKRHRLNPSQFQLRDADAMFPGQVDLCQCGLGPDRSQAMQICFSLDHLLEAKKEQTEGDAKPFWCVKTHPTETCHFIDLDGPAKRGGRSRRLRRRVLEESRRRQASQ